MYRTDNLAEVLQMFNAITAEPGSQYSLGYYQKSELQAGEKRDIRVKTRPPNLVVRARETNIATVGASRRDGQN